MPVGTPLHYFDEISSTNDEAARLAELGAPEGTTVVASAQTAGRGRFGRTWFSPPGAGLYVSVIVRDRRAAPYLSLAGGVAVADGIRAATALPVELKWPNDVVIAGGLAKPRKLAGILAEGTTSADGIQYVILGFGINLLAAAYPPEIADRATSLESELGRPVDRDLVLSATLAELDARLVQLAAGDRAPLLARWRALAPSAIGSAVEWDSASGPRAGRTDGIDDDGALRVKTDGAIERIISGIVRWN
jgi:BirA family transcriptional regulator, biotin operon repressor / biotin---[acetyl-CoA-carboxylase] ligase